MTNTAHWSELHITPAELSERIVEGEVVVLDVRFRPGKPSRHEHYLDAHVPGARWVDLVSDFGGTARGAEHPTGLPDRAALQERLRAWGVNDDTEIVTYGDSSPFAAARAWWVLRWFGHERVRVLDGGIATWIDEGLPTASGEEPSADPGTVTLGRGGGLPTITPDEALGLAHDGALFDTRPVANYVGSADEPGTGHIPGAISLPSLDAVDGDARLRRRDELSSVLGAADTGRPVGVYCGGGLAAAHQVLALRALGVNASLLLESWSGWSSDATRPVTVGEGRWGDVD